MGVSARAFKDTSKRRIKVFVYVILILIASITFVTPIRSEVSLSGFKIISVYWGTGQPLEVSPGDVETLTLVLRYELGYSFENLKADLYLSDGFKAVGGKNRVSVLYTGHVSFESIVKLEFPIFVTPDVTIGRYTANLKLEYIYVTAPAKEELKVNFEVTGKPDLEVRLLNSSVYEGKQRILIALTNEGDAAAQNLKIKKVHSSSASVELENTTFPDSLEPRDNVTASLSLFVPTGIEGRIVPLTVEASYLGPRYVFYSLSETLQIAVHEAEEIKITTQFPGKSAAPGDTVRFQVRLENTFGVEMGFRISVDSIPPNWTASVKSESGEYATEVSLDSGKFIELVVEVKSPHDARMGEEYRFSVKAESHDGNLISSLPLSISLTEVENVKITTKFPEVTVEAGKVVQYPITIANLGDADRLLMLSVEPPADWKAVFKSGALEVSKLYMEAWGSEDLVIEVTPPSTVDIDAYTIPVQVESESGVVYAEMDLKATIVGSYDLTLESSTLLTSVTTGGSTALTAKVTNTGLTSLTGVSLDIDVPGEWETSINPIQVELLKPRESFTFTVVVNTPEDAVAGDYMIALTGLSDQVESDGVEVRVTVTTPTSWGLVGVGIAAVMVIALVFVFMKFKRR